MYDNFYVKMKLLGNKWDFMGIKSAICLHKFLSIVGFKSDITLRMMSCRAVINILNKTASTSI